jgi:hypothetical protein
MMDITREDFIKKYGHVKVKFSSYYKYSFEFSGNLPDGRKISVSVGGNSDDIYRINVDSECEETVIGLDPYCGSIYENGSEIEGFYDY